MSQVVRILSRKCHASYFTPMGDLQKYHLHFLLDFTTKVGNPRYWEKGYESIPGRVF